jgi:hypothetical protein
MPTPLVTENWTLRRFAPGKYGSRVFDITGVADEAAALLALLAAGVFEGSLWPVLALEPISVPKGGIEFSRTGRMYTATVSYSTGGSSGTFTPLERKWQCRKGWMLDERPMLRDGAGRAVVNSNRDPLQTDFTKRRKVPFIEMVRNETGSDLISKNNNYGNRWNTEPVAFPKIGTAAAGEAFLDTIEVVDDFTSDSTYLRVLYRFLFRPRLTLMKPDGSGEEERHGFYVPAPDVGYLAYDSSSDSGQRIRWGPTHVDSGREVPFPVMLNGFGAPLRSMYRFAATLGGVAGLYDFDDRDAAPTYYTTDDDGTQLWYDPTDGGVDFNALDIAANV